MNTWIGLRFLWPAQEQKVNRRHVRSTLIDQSQWPLLNPWKFSHYVLNYEPTYYFTASNQVWLSLHQIIPGTINRTFSMFCSLKFEFSLHRRFCLRKLPRNYWPLRLHLEWSYCDLQPHQMDSSLMLFFFFSAYRSDRVRGPGRSPTKWITKCVPIEWEVEEKCSGNPTTRTESLRFFITYRVFI